MRHFLLLGLVLGACEVGEVDPIEESMEIIAAGGDPCQNANIRRQANIKRNAEGKYIGTNRRDVIFGTKGNDIIFGNGGDDLICAGAGDDYIDGGDGRDHIHAGAGEDTVHGRAGSDQIWGGAGADVLFGDTLDDHIRGEDGNDIMIGGHGTDYFDGGPDNDFMRGDTGNDFFRGGPGHDIASFATALPPGQPEVRNDGSPNPVTGVAIAFEGKCGGGGCSNGDGGQEQLGDIEEIVGSPFNDRIEAAGKPVQDKDGAPSTVYINVARAANNDLIDVGVVVIGSDGNDNIQVAGNNGVINVTGAPFAAGEGCAVVGANHVRCDVNGYIGARPHRKAPFHYVSVWGDGGADNITLQGDFPREFEAHASGGRGNDHMVGGNEQDVFFTGVTGEDRLEGNGGDDALLSESEHTLAWRDDKRPEASQYNDGADTLDGGAGDDQLVADYVCGGHRYIGGPGRDIAGFARSGKHAIHAQLGGPAATKTKWWGKAANMDLCGNLEGRWTTWRTGQDADLEVLESADGPDHLWGDDRNNVLWGRGGGDTMYGLSGDDELLGADGNDKLFGGPGNNEIKYGQGH